jgi:ABC-type branched-subunit amino acid transport system substrate-binding protein
VNLRRLVVLMMLLGLVVAACSRSDNNASTNNSSTSSTTAAGGGKGLAAGAFGDLGTVCKPGAAKAVTGQTGINGTTISAGVLSDKGFSGRPGLTREFHDIAQAVTKWCDAHGGVDGYKINADLLDAALTNAPQMYTKACDTDFFLVAGGAVFDNQGVPIQLKCGLPNIAGYVVTPEAAGADLTVQPIPNPTNQISLGELPWLQKQFPGTTDHVGVMTGDIGTTITVADREQEAAKQLGWKIVNYQKYSPLGESNWTPFVQTLKDKNVQGLIWVGEPENLAKMLQAAQTINYAPKWIRTDANHYDDNLITVGGNAINNIYVHDSFWPFTPASKAAENPATQQYLDLLKQYGPSDGRRALLGVQGLSGWMLFFKSIDACVKAGTLTRDCVFEKARSTKNWTGGGLHVPTNQGVAADCFAIAQATPTGWKFPKVTGFGTHDVQGFFTCDPKKFVFNLTGNYGAGLKCPSGKPNPLPSQCAQ